MAYYAAYIQIYRSYRSIDWKKESTLEDDFWYCVFKYFMRFPNGFYRNHFSLYYFFSILESVSKSMIYTWFFFLVLNGVTGFNLSLHKRFSSLITEYVSRSKPYPNECLSSWLDSIKNNFCISYSIAFCMQWLINAHLV